jgi:hypothetical protein
LIDNSYRSEVIPQRLILVAVTTSVEKLRRMSQGSILKRHKLEILTFIPEHVVRQIPKYNALLGRATPAEQVEGDPDFKDNTTHNHRAFVQTIECVGGASLRPLTGSEEEVKATLMSLLGMYGVSVALEIETLQDAVLSHIETCPNLPVETFLDFARLAYDGNQQTDMEPHETDSPIGKLIKRKLAVLLPQLLQNGTAQRIKAEGGTLSTELLEVMIEHFSGKGGIKVET